MAWAAAVAMILLVAAPELARSFDESILDSVLVIGSEQGSGGKRKLLQQMSGEPEPLMQWLVTKHNELRYRHGVQMLTWDWSLAWNAYNYVVGCPNGHSGQQGIGENLAWGHESFNHAMRDWYDEIQFYSFNAPGFAENTGHFTQMVWADAGKIGCAANLRCNFRTWICQFTPAGNLVNYGGTVDTNLWTRNVPAPSSQYITGTKPDGSPSYMTYDPTGESTRGLPQPRYGELKNFGYVPKPGQVVVITDWQKFIPTDVLQIYLPWAVLEQHLKPEILALLKPETAAVPKPGEAVHKEPQRAIVGWQQYLPTSVIKQYVPAPILAKYVPEGTMLATEKDAAAKKQTGLGNSSSSSSNAVTASPAPAEPQPASPAPSDRVSKPLAALGPAPAIAAAQIWAAPMKEPYEAGQRLPPCGSQPSTGKGIHSAVSAQLVASGSRGPVSPGAQHTEDKASPSEAAVKSAHSAPKQQQQEKAQHGTAAPAARKQMLQKREKGPAAATQKKGHTLEAGALDTLLGFAGFGDDTAEPATRYAPVNPSEGQSGYPQGGQQPVGHVPSQQSQTYYPQQQPAAAVPRPNSPAEQPVAAVPMPQSNPQGGQPAAGVDPVGPAPTTPAPPGGMQEVLDAHNFYRARHQAPPLVWDDQLAASALSFASGCPNSPSGTQGVGENLAWGYKDGPSAVDEWYKEGQQYNYNDPGFTMTSGHFTQIVWQDTQRVGCALVTSCNMATMICHYSPAGNVVGADWSTQVKPPGPGASTGPRPRPRQPVAAVMPPGYPSQQQPAGYGMQQQQQPIAAVPYPVGYPTPQQQQQPIAAVPYPAGYPTPQQQQQQQPPPYPYGFQTQQQQPVAAVPYPGYPYQGGYMPQQQQQQQPYPGYAVPQPQQGAPVAAVMKPGMVQQQQQFAQLSQPQYAQGYPAYPPYQTYQPYPVQAVPKPQAMTVAAQPGRHSDAIRPARYVAAPQQASSQPTRGNNRGLAGYSAPAFLTPRPASDGSLPATSHRPATAATTKPFSAPAFLTPLAAAAVDKPSNLQPPKAQQGPPGIKQGLAGRLPHDAPAQQPSQAPSQKVVIAAVDKPPFPVDVPRSQWPHLAQPTSNTGAPFSLSSPMQPAAAAVLSPELQAALDRHNQYRTAHQAPPLAWDDSIASSAQKWVAGCPNGHSGTRGVGENMAWGYPSLADAVDAWYNEVKQYDFNNPGWNTATGHFTALVWVSTTKLGCAINAACSWPTYVCQYGPPGNIIGVDWSQQVKPKVAQPAKPSLPTITTAPKEPVASGPATPSKPAPAPTKPPAAAPAPTKSPAAVPTSAKASPAPSSLKLSQPTKKAISKPAIRPVQLTADQKAALDKHNTYRATHGVPALSWDPKLAAAAQSWADSCPWGHSNSAYGENMAWGYNNMSDVVEAWYNEGESYDYGYPTDQPGTGHFSQLIWKSTTKLGCAVSKSCSWKTFVCNYDPAGNVDGSWGASVQPPQHAASFSDFFSSSAAVLKPGAHKPTPNVAAVLKPDYAVALDRHNMYRQRHQAAALVWDDALAASAAKWAAGCPSGHSGYTGVGENMAWGYSSLLAAVDAWYNEVKKYDFNNPGWNTATGHFTALVWRKTSKLGCSINTACSMTTYVCQYQVPGNVIGVDWSQQVKPAVLVAAPQPSPPPTSPPPPSRPKPLPSPSPSPAAAKPPAPAATPGAADMQRVLDLHNTYRTAHQAPALVWDEKLVASAQTWANTCTFGSSRTAGVGENLGFGYTTFPDAVQSWYQQVSKYDFNNPGWASGSGLFTQMVWRDTKAIGCAVNTACTWAMYVCHYSPPGNMVGSGVDWTQEVKPALDVVPATAAVLKPGQDGADGPQPSNVAEDSAWDAQDTRLQEQMSHKASKGAGVLTGPDSRQAVAAVPLPDAAEPTDPDLQEALRRTNLYRKRHQVAALSWDEGLAQQAATFLADCPTKHSTIRNIGESLGWGFRTFADVVDAWYNEVNSYHFDKPGWSITAGHFSQLVWSDTTNMGCAVNRKCTWETYVCQYTPAGNVVSTDWTTQVKPAVQDSPQDAQQLYNPTLLPGESYYNDNRQAAPSSGSSGSQSQDSLTPAPAAPYQPIDTTAQDPAETPVTPAPAAPQLPFQTPQAAPQNPYPAPTMPAPGQDQAAQQQTLPGAGAAATGASSQVPGLSAELQAALDAANNYRRQHSAPDLAWDDSLASQAGSYIASCPMGHSGMQGVGENLAWGFDSMQAAVKAWYDEVSSYDFNNGGFSGATGHFTQLVWKDSAKVGCAVNKACSMATYICQYTPAGNVMGVDWSQQVQPATTAATPPAPPAAYAPAPPIQQQQAPPAATPQPINPWGQQQQTNWWQQPQQQQQQQSYYTPTQPAPAAPQYPQQQQTPATPAPAAPAAPAAAPTDPSVPADYASVLQSTNTYRAKHQAPGLSWDTALAARAQQYADSCPGGHSGDPGVGENLAWGYPSWQSSVDAWYNEVSSYSYANPGFSGATGHFTQLVWKDTTRVGCGYNSRCAMATYVCQYSPAGNVLGDGWSSEVLPPVS